MIEKEKLSRVVAIGLDQSWESTRIVGSYGANYAFRGQFVSIENESYNLNQLVRYGVAEKPGQYTPVRYLVLSFR